MAAVTGTTCCVTACAAPRETHSGAQATMTDSRPTTSTLSFQQSWQNSLVAEKGTANGCFKAEYPSNQWKPVTCRQASKAEPSRRPTVATALRRADDSITDYALKANGLIRKAEGSFPEVSGVHFIYGNGTTVGADEFSLQLDSDANATTGACAGHANCHVWQQFIYAMHGEGAVFMQYWLINYGSACPGGWSGDGSGSCYRNSDDIAVPAIAANRLGSLKLIAEVNAGGSDTVTLLNGTQAYRVSGSDSVLQLASVWTGADFNILGNGNGTGAFLNTGSSVTTRLAVDDGTSKAPRCIGNGAVTGETNDLHLGRCTAYGGSSPAIRFTGTN